MRPDFLHDVPPRGLLRSHLLLALAALAAGGLIGGLAGYFVGGGL